MSSGRGALVLTYHAIEDGPPPLCLLPGLFERHVETLAQAGAAFLTVSELAGALRRGALPRRAVAITFDDGCSSVLHNAAPVLGRHGARATVFAVSGHLGGANDWPSQPASAPRLRLLGEAELAELTSAGWEIGSHTRTHPLLAGLDRASLVDELEGSRATLEEVARKPVRSLAFPYGQAPPRAAEALTSAGYDCACGSALERVASRSDLLCLPRVDAHYLRRPGLLRAVLDRETAYLRLRRAGAGVRRTLGRSGWRA